jgi:hypothetical protein
VRVSIIVPAFNAEPYIGDALRSLMRQSFDDFEVLVIDDGSTDGTRAVVHEVSVADPRVRLQTQQHTGVVAALNHGADLSRSPYLAWLGADDVALPERLALQVDYMESHPSVAVLGGMIMATDAQLRPLLPVRYPTDPAQVQKLLPGGNSVAAPTAMIRAAAYHAVGGCRAAFNEGAEDYDLWLRLSEGHQVANLREILGLYRIHPQQMSAARIQPLLVSTVAAQLSARARRAGRWDPYAELGRISYHLLVHHEPLKSDVDTALLDVTAGQATFLALIGQYREAMDLLHWASTLTEGSRITREARARALLAWALACWKAGQRGAALRAGLTAAIVDPARMGRLIVRGASLARWRSAGRG